MTRDTVSVRSRVVFWYAFSLIALSTLVVLFLYLAEDHLIVDEVKENLMTITDRAASDVRFEGEIPRADENLVYYMDRTWVVLLDEDGKVFSGSYPDDFPESMKSGEETPQPDGGGIHEVKGDGTDWFVYDRLLLGEGGGQLWIRGIAEGDLAVISPPVYAVFRLFFLIFPILVVIAVAGSWYITRRVFAPFRHIADTVRAIQEGDDFSLRVALHRENRSGTVPAQKEGKTTGFFRAREDEVQRTADLFDQMLERIEDGFERERKFTDNASHELRTPVAVIMAECEYAITHLEKAFSITDAQITGPVCTQAGENTQINNETQDNADRTVVEKSLTSILSQAKRMDELLSRLLFLARADSNRQVLNMETVDISLLAEEAAAAASQMAAVKQIGIRVDAPEGLYMSGDELMLGQMFSNLIGNAVKYGKQGGHVLVTVRRDENGPDADAAEGGSGQGIRITVEDDGIGIEAEKLPHIWERFYRVDHMRRDSFGLGLPIVRWIVRSHAGTVQVSSLPGRGSVFTVLF